MESSRICAGCFASKEKEEEEQQHFSPSHGVQPALFTGNCPFTVSVTTTRQMHRLHMHNNNIINDQLASLPQATPVVLGVSQ
jgi:hypothetical protein